MSDEQPRNGSASRRGPGRAIPSIVGLGAVVGALLALIVYFLLRSESDWVLVLACALCATAAGVRLKDLIRPSGSK